jgi:hypothetical protein
MASAQTILQQMTDRMIYVVLCVLLFMETYFVDHQASYLPQPWSYSLTKCTENKRSICYNRLVFFQFYYRSLIF